MKEKKLSSKEEKAILEIAKKYIYTMQERGDFEYRNNDEEDFLGDISVGSLQLALEAAYRLGKESAKA